MVRRGWWRPRSSFISNLEQMSDIKPVGQHNYDRNGILLPYGSLARRRWRGEQNVIEIMTLVKRAEPLGRRMA